MSPSSWCGLHHQRRQTAPLSLRRVLRNSIFPLTKSRWWGTGLTDVLVGNRLGMYTVLQPIDPSGQPCRHDHRQRFEVKLAQLAGADLPNHGNPPSHQNRHQRSAGSGSRGTDAVIADLASSSAPLAAGEPVVLVASGAVGLGCNALQLEQRPTELEALQATAAVGQGRLMTLYGLCRPRPFCRPGAPDPMDLASRRRYQNAAEPRAVAQLGGDAGDQ